MGPGHDRALVLCRAQPHLRLRRPGRHPTHALQLARALREDRQRGRPLRDKFPPEPQVDVRRRPALTPSSDGKPGIEGYHG